MTQRQVNRWVAGVLIVVLMGILLVVGQQVLRRVTPFGLKGQTNTTLTFYGKVVDQDGNPLEGAKIEYDVESYPTDWTFSSRARLNNRETVTFTSEADGRFSGRITGCKLYRRSATLDGYRHFGEEYSDDATEHITTKFYMLIAWSNLLFKSAEDRPAIYVFVKDGVREVSALPCHGGYCPIQGIFRPNEPGWPKEPSLKDVAYRPIGGIAATSPASLPATAPATAPKPNVTDRR
jgi:hypothetical protein